MFGDIALLVAANAVSMAAVYFAGQIALSGQNGYGWFLLIAVLCISTMKLKVRAKAVAEDTGEDD